jgi:hypothetical protein
MKKINEEKLLAFLYVTIKTRRRKENVVKIAEVCKTLSEFYNSSKALADKLGASYETIRAFIKITQLPNEVKELIKKNEIPFDVAQRIGRIKNNKTQIKVAKLVADMNPLEARELIQYAKKFPNASLKEFKERILAPKRQGERVVVVLLPLKEDLYSSLTKIAKTKNSRVEKIILEILKKEVEK